MSEAQNVDGWLCAAGEYNTVVSTTPTGYELMSCWLAAPSKWKGTVLPPGTYISRDDRWLFPVTGEPGSE